MKIKHDSCIISYIREPTTFMGLFKEKIIKGLRREYLIAFMSVQIGSVSQDDGIDQRNNKCRRFVNISKNLVDLALCHKRTCRFKNDDPLCVWLQFVEPNPHRLCSCRPPRDVNPNHNNILFADA